MVVARTTLRLAPLALALVGVLLLACLEVGCSDRTADAPSGESPAHGVFPAHGAYAGAYIDFGLTEDSVTLDTIEEFEKLAGKRITIVASSSFWGEQRFPARNLTIIARHKAIPLVFWSPWDRPYNEEVGPDRFGLHAVLAGEWNDYIDTWADAARDYGAPILVSWGLEMNGCWFPWSGCYYNGAATTVEQPPPGPELYKAAFRFVVDRTRARGATNVLWGFHANNFSYPFESWNTLPAYYPGPEYVDWLGLSAYGKQAADDDWMTFHQIFDNAYVELCKLDPVKPIVIAEWGVGEFPESGSKAEWFREAFTAIESEYTRVKAAVYWHERWRNADDSYSNLRIHSSPEALEAFRQGLSSPFWKEHLIENPSSSMARQQSN